MDKTIAFIPVRGGSKSIPLKNIRPMCGRPLVFWTVRAACQCETIDRVYVATDSEEIRNAVNSFCLELQGPFSKVETVGRSKESASDTASTESAMIEFAESHNFETMVLIQATSPLLASEDLDRGLVEYAKPDCDSVLSVVEQKRFIWNVSPNGSTTPVNYDVFHRPRRQDFQPYYVENGAFYITSREDLIRTGNRVSGEIHAIVMPEDTFVEIDEPDDWPIVEKLLEKRERKHQEKKGFFPTEEIRVLLTDCDGCLTDGGMYYSEQGDELKRFDTRDGMGLGILKGLNIATGIVTSESRMINQRRADKLGVDYILQGCTDKLKAVKSICEELGVSLTNVAYVGDDINDVAVLEAIANAGGFAACPADATASAKEVSSYICIHNGGHGAVREVCDYIIGHRIIM